MSGEHGGSGHGGEHEPSGPGPLYNKGESPSPLTPEGRAEIARRKQAERLKKLKEDKEKLGAKAKAEKWKNVRRLLLSVLLVGGPTAGVVLGPGWVKEKIEAMDRAEAARKAAEKEAIIKKNLELIPLYHQVDEINARENHTPGSKREEATAGRGGTSTSAEARGGAPTWAGSEAVEVGATPEGPLFEEARRAFPVANLGVVVRALGDGVTEANKVKKQEVVFAKLFAEGAAAVKRDKLIEGLVGNLDQDAEKAEIKLAVESAIEFVKSSDEFGVEVPKEIVYGLIAKESMGNRTAKNIRSGATGLMQIIPDTAKRIATRIKLSDYNLEDPNDNAMIGVSFLAQLYKKYGNWGMALSAFNGGDKKFDMKVRGLLDGVEKRDDTSLTFPSSEKMSETGANMATIPEFWGQSEQKKYLPEGKTRWMTLEYPFGVAALGPAARKLIEGDMTPKKVDTSTIHR